jgi:hypothetical protein
MQCLIVCSCNMQCLRLVVVVQFCSTSMWCSYEAATSATAVDGRGVYLAYQRTAKLHACTHSNCLNCFSVQPTNQNCYTVFHLLHLSQQVTHNRSLDGVLDELHSGRMTEAGSTDLLAGGDSDYSDSERHAADAVLPGAKRGDDGSRTVCIYIYFYIFI